ncbi:MAG: hypothetical protein V4587_13695 [Acidobacteriota bacterium]
MSDPAILPNPPLANVYGPITAGQMLERTFKLLRENFKLFFGIVLILIGVEIVVGGITGGIFGANAFLIGRPQMGSASLGRILFMMPIVFVGAVLLFILIQIIQGALFIATGAKLTSSPITIGDACKLAADQAGRLIGISLLILLRVIGYVLLFIIAFGILAGIIGAIGGLMHIVTANQFSRGHLPGFGAIAFLVLLVIAGAIAYLIFWLWLCSRYSLSIPAALSENLSVTESIRRSIHLSQGSRGRLYALFLMIVVADLAIAAVTVPFQLILRHGAVHQHVAAFGVFALLLAGFRILTGAFIVAIMGIATALCYYDLRVRKEGFGVVTPPPPAVPIAPAEAWTLPPNEPTGDVPIS